VSSSGSKKSLSKGARPDKALQRLDGVVTAALERVRRLEREVVRMDAQGKALEGLLEGVTSGERGPREMIDTLHVLEEENRDLRRRLDEGRAGVDRLLARVKFLEEQP
jgi:predicted RNase H-like nuclease (RuvC/YqgF family)